MSDCCVFRNVNFCLFQLQCNDNDKSVEDSSDFVLAGVKYDIHVSDAGVFDIWHYQSEYSMLSYRDSKFLLFTSTDNFKVMNYMRSDIFAACALNVVKHLGNIYDLCDRKLMKVSILNNTNTIAEFMVYKVRDVCYSGVLDYKSNYLDMRIMLRSLHNLR